MSDHGTRERYQAGCKCPDCRKANAEYSVALRLYIAKGGIPLGRRIPATDTRRHVNSLLREDFTRDDVASRCGISRDLLEPWYKRHHRYVTVRTHLRIQRVWRQACLFDSVEN